MHERKAVRFGDYLDYECEKPGWVTNDGLFYKLRCQTNGYYVNRIWLPCRERQTCLKPPPRPTDASGLAFSTSLNVPEFESAVYECKEPGYIVPGTPDGKFRTPCKRTGNFEQSVRITWPKCEPKPTPIPEPRTW